MQERNIKFGDAFSEAMKLWKANFGVIIIVGIFVYLPAQIVIEIASYFLDKIFVVDNIKALKLMSYVYDLIRYLIGAVASIGIIYITYSRCMGDNNQYSAKDLLRYGLKRWPKMIWAGFIAGLKALPYFLLLIIPGVKKGVRLSFVDCNVSTKEFTASENCDYSESIVENRWWSVAGFLILVFICEFLLEAVCTILFWELLDITFITVFLGVFARLLETYFIVLKAVFYFKLENCTELSDAQTEPAVSCDTVI